MPPSAVSDGSRAIPRPRTGADLITLTGLARFRVAEELDVRTPYRQVRADWTEFADDFHEPDVEPPGTRAGLIAALNIYSDAKDMSVDWDAVGKQRTLKA
ncbi:MAG: hypothetical protein R3C04_04140 [Hyphomonas sp.]